MLARDRTPQCPVRLCDMPRLTTGPPEHSLRRPMRHLSHANSRSRRSLCPWKKQPDSAASSQKPTEQKRVASSERAWLLTPGICHFRSSSFLCLQNIPFKFCQPFSNLPCYSEPHFAV